MENKFKSGDRVKIIKTDFTTNEDQHIGKQATVRDIWAADWYTAKEGIYNVELDKEKGCEKEILVLYESQMELIKEEVSKVENQICFHPNKYMNEVSANLKFWVCPDCKKDLGDV